MEKPFQSGTFARYQSMRVLPQRGRNTLRGRAKTGFSFYLLPLVIFLIAIAPQIPQALAFAYEANPSMVLIYQIACYVLGVGILLRNQFVRMVTIFLSKLLVFVYALALFLILLNFGDLQFNLTNPLNQPHLRDVVLDVLAIIFTAFFPVLGIKILNMDDVKQNFGLHPWDE